MNLDTLFGALPQLQSDRVRLAKVEEKHLEELFGIYSNERVFDYCGIIPKHNKDTVRKMIPHFERDYLKRSVIKWGIFNRQNQQEDRLIGIAEAFNFNQKVNMVTIGYFLAEPCWGQGLATETVGLLTRFLFEDAEVNRIQAEVMPANEASKKVLLKNGYVHEGTLRQASLWAGKGIVDLEMYSQLRAEYAGK
ncbi:GNAT family protein [Paenibacillus sp. YPG26]|uniref:GNAT family N-acetyltransferase n=1 Tax=Paenibacillus sp. YPG26 TaxID=2878915 RepID=UPI00203DB265|nr:GNAT family protein [Paenibacillus sp. YPG26]USB33957.1 GNAT family N-acetyltransferase [Paenibacillus sp. YPG26]